LSQKLFAICGIISPIVFGILTIIAGLITPNYDHLVNFVSELGAIGAPNAIIQRINFLLVGILIMVFAFGLHRGIAKRKGSFIGPLLVAIFGLSAVLSGIFSADLIQPGSFSDNMHMLSSAIGSTAAIIGFFVISDRLEKDPLWKSFRYFSILIAVVAIVVSVVGNGVLGALGYPGLSQRLYMAVLFLWIEVMAVHLFQISSQ
jgi:hypothetical membrane protein